MNDISYKELDLWIREELSQHGEWLVDRFVDALESGGHVDTGALADSFDYRTSAEQGAQVLEVSFLTYGRLAEVRSRRTKSAERFSSSGNHAAWGSRNHRPKRMQWYNKNRYAGYGRLIRRLTAGMSDAELKRIRGILERAKADLAAK